MDFNANYCEYLTSNNGELTILR